MNLLPVKPTQSRVMRIKKSKKHFSTTSVFLVGRLYSWFSTSFPSAVQRIGNGRYGQFITFYLYLSDLLILILCSSKGSLPCRTVLHELLKWESFPQAAVLHELLPYWSLLPGAVLQEQTAPQVHSGPWGHESCLQVYFNVGFPWDHNLLESRLPSAI